MDFYKQLRKLLLMILFLFIGTIAFLLPSIPWYFAYSKNNCIEEGKEIYSCSIPNAMAFGVLTTLFFNSRNTHYYFFYWCNNFINMCHIIWYFYINN